MNFTGGSLLEGCWKSSKLAKLRGWSPMDLPVKWHFLAYKFDMKYVFQENAFGMVFM